MAIDSVGFDFLAAKWPDFARQGADDYLHEAALANHPPSGTRELSLHQAGTCGPAKEEPARNPRGSLDWSSIGPLLVLYCSSIVPLLFLYFSPCAPRSLSQGRGRCSRDAEPC